MNAVNSLSSVIPAKAGTHFTFKMYICFKMDSRIRGNDDLKGHVSEFFK